MRFIVLLLPLLALVGPEAAWAVEYRLKVASVLEGGVAHFLDGRIGRGEGEVAMTRLEASLDRGDFPLGSLLYDRPIQVPGKSLARAFGAVEVAAELIQGGNGADRWAEIRWEGKPGERTVWVIASTAANNQEVYHLALGSSGALRYFIPYALAGSQKPAGAVGLSLQFIGWRVERGDLWDRYLSRAVDLRGGVAAVVGTNENPQFADHLFLLVDQPAQPATFKAVVGWRRRPSLDQLIQSPGAFP